MFPSRLLVSTIVASGLLLSACSGINANSLPPGSGDAGGNPGIEANASGSVVDALGSLPVKGRAPKTGYDRDLFGYAWKDIDKNGCDTRNDMLIRDLVERQMDGDCTVMSGVLYPDPYTGEEIVFVRGKSLVDIDHVVSLGNAWVTGAAKWSKGERELFANDPLNLLAVEASANRQKSDGDAATWLPSNKSFRCDFVALQVAAKVKYGLWVTKAERKAMLGVLSSCPGQELPSAGGVPLLD